jgi:hypothetical protein
MNKICNLFISGLAPEDICERINRQSATKCNQLFKFSDFGEVVELDLLSVLIHEAIYTFLNSFRQNVVFHYIDTIKHVMEKCPDMLHFKHLELAIDVEPGLFLNCSCKLTRIYTVFKVLIKNLRINKSRANHLLGLMQRQPQSISTLEQLVKYGADINCQTFEIHSESGSSEKQEAEVIEIHPKRNTPLQQAVTSLHNEPALLEFHVRKLLKMKADPNIPYDDGTSIFFKVFHQYKRHHNQTYLKILKQLIRNKAEPRTYPDLFDIWNDSYLDLQDWMEKNDYFKEQKYDAICQGIRHGKFIARPGIRKFPEIRDHQSVMTVFVLRDMVLRSGNQGKAYPKVFMGDPIYLELILSFIVPNPTRKVIKPDTLSSSSEAPEKIEFIKPDASSSSLEVPEKTEFIKLSFFTYYQMYKPDEEEFKSKQLERETEQLLNEEKKRKRKADKEEKAEKKQKTAIEKERKADKEEKAGKKQKKKHSE